MRLWATRLVVAVAILGHPRVGAAQGAAEIERFSALLSVRGSMTVAEIGAGSGTFTVGLAKRLDGDGRIFATELDPSRLEEIRGAVTAATLGNVTVLEAGVESTNLPDACCDLVYMRDVYHHLTKPSATLASIASALRAGGRLAVIDFRPRGQAPPGSAPNRGGHGIARAQLEAEVTAAGFDIVSASDDWPGGNFIVVFAKR
ncbi:MAG: class I SAM-dependent methyltransferase [Vicinamibacterales bacterium]